jgi:hypothetical protein
VVTSALGAHRGAERSSRDPMRFFRFSPRRGRCSAQPSAPPASRDHPSSVARSEARLGSRPDRQAGNCRCHFWRSGSCGSRVASPGTYTPGRASSVRRSRSAHLVHRRREPPDDRDAPTRAEVEGVSVDCASPTGAAVDTRLSDDIQPRGSVGHLSFLPYLFGLWI